MGGIAGAASSSDLISPSTLLCPNFLLAQLRLAWHYFSGRSQRQKLLGASDGKSPAAASLIAQMLSPPPAVPVCLCILSPLETATQKCFLVQNLKQSPAFARCLLSTYLCACCTSVPLGLSVFVKAQKKAHFATDKWERNISRMSLKSSNLGEFDSQGHQ